MVQPSPFERLLQRAHEQAQTDPNGAFEQRDELYGKSLTDLDVRHLSAFVAHVGGAGLGRFEDTLEFATRCLEHPALDKDGDTEASIQRAIAVLAHCTGDNERAETAIAVGVRNDTERCRVSLLTGQALVARVRLKDAVPHLSTACTLMASIDDAELRHQATTIALNIARIAEKRHQAAGLCAISATDVLAASLASGGWEDIHKGKFHQAQAQVAAGRPARALQLVQEMMQLEHDNNAGTEPRFFSASVACRAQICRGQLKIAKGALSACESMANDAGKPDHLVEVVDDLKAQFADAEESIATPATAS